MIQLRQIRFLRSFFFALAFVYVTFHTLHGGQGVIALLKENHKMEQLNEQLGETSIKRAKLERRVNLMRPQSLDRDMLEEQAHRLLGMSQSGGILVIPE